MNQNNTTGYFMEPGNHVVIITEVQKKEEKNRKFWLFTFENESWLRAYHSILCKESTKNVLTSLGKACGKMIHDKYTDDDIFGLKGMTLLVQVAENNGSFPKITRWRRVPEAEAGVRTVAL